MPVAFQVQTAEGFTCKVHLSRCQRKDMFTDIMRLNTQLRGLMMTGIKYKIRNASK